jgi:chemotaxis protein MotD
LDIPPKQSIAYPLPQSIALGRVPIVRASQAIRTEPVGPAPSRILPGVLGEDLSIVGNEKHFQPAAPTIHAPAPPTAAPATDARFQSIVPAAGVQKMYAGRVTIQDSLPPPDERRAPLASRAEPQINATPSPTSVLQQLAGTIAQEIESAGAAPSAWVDPTSVGRQPVGHEPLRILKVALEPAELGQVIVRLRLTGETLELRVTADRAETASLLDRDRHLLSRILESSGYSAGDITVQPATPGPQPGTLTARAAEPQAGTQTAPQFQSNGSAGERHPSRSQDGHGHSQQEAERDELDIDPRRRGDLYV